MADPKLDITHRSKNLSDTSLPLCRGVRGKGTQCLPTHVRRGRRSIPF
jgi:hypothetical protein